VAVPLGLLYSRLHGLAEYRLIPDGWMLWAQLTALLGAGTAATAITWRARGRLRRLPAAERLSVLRALADDPRVQVQEIVQPFRKQLKPPGREATPAPGPAGTGQEPAPAD
jgi:hypothetical protein